MRPVSVSLVLAAAVAMVPAMALAGTASFSMDGKSVCFAWSTTVEGCAVDVLSLDTAVVTPHEFKQPDHPPDWKAVATAPDGRFLLLAERALWAWSPTSDALQKLHDAPEGVTFTDIACQPKTGRLLVTGSLAEPDDVGHTGRVFVADSPGGEWQSVGMRRLDVMDAPVFLPDGSLLFGAEGDLWHGTVEGDGLAAERCAPLADRETYGGTPMQVGVAALAVSGRKVYAHIARMGGSGWGDVIRLDLPKRVEAGLRERYQQYGRALKSVEWLEECPSQSFLCHSPDGSRVLFTSRGDAERRHYLVTKNGAPEPLPKR